MVDVDEGQSFERTASIIYRSKTRSHIGRLDRPDIAVITELAKRNAGSHKCAMELWHNNHLPTFFVEYDVDPTLFLDCDVDVGDVGNDAGDAVDEVAKKKRKKKFDMLVHPDLDQTLQQYIDQLKREKIFSLSSWTGSTATPSGPPGSKAAPTAPSGSKGAPPSGSKPPPSGSKAATGQTDTVYFVPEEIRKILKDIIYALRFLHRVKKRSLRGVTLSMNNFGMLQGFCRMYGVGTCGTVLDSGEVSPADKGADYLAIHTFIMAYIFHGYPNNHIPPDMHDLLDLMRDYSKMNYNEETSAKVDNLIEHHIAIMAHSERLFFVKNCSDKEEQFRAYKYTDGGGRLTAYDRVLTRMNSADEWTSKRFTGTNVVVFYHVLKCYRKGQKHYIDGPTQKISNNAVKKSDKDHVVKRSALSCCRNLASHLGEHLAAKSSCLAFTEMHVDIMVMSVFGDMVLDFSKCLNEEGILLDIITWKNW